jgi:predicted mannosyl-3-phosphoglycerate phosphatase (HAD superfamily)
MTGFKAIALDYDGTLTEGDRPTDDVLEALRATRAEGRRLVLVTGRILDELRQVFPEVEDEFDAIVAENGAVIATVDGVADVVAPVAPELASALAARDIPVRSGRVILACDGEHATAVFEEIGRHRLDAQVVRNRNALMVIPSGVTKATGLLEVLGELGVSSHCTLGVGDAENDLPLLEACEVGVAVANAVDRLAEGADVVLEEPDGRGIVELLRGPVVSGARRVDARRRLELGVGDGGRPVTVPTSHLSLLVTGGSGSGKSFVVGMLVEQLAQLRYSVLVLDREGDHLGLGSRRGIVVLGGLPDPPPVEEVMAVLDHRFGSVVLDLSQLPVPEQDAYVARLLPHVLELRRACGSPHWLVFDEAHALAGPVELVEIPFPLPGGGSVFATYRPQDLPAAIREGLDAVIWLPGAGEGAPEAVRTVVDGFGVGDPAAAGPDLERGSAVLLDAHGAEPQVFELGERAVPHIRHWHRYTDSELSPEHAFYFGEAGREGIARNVREFHRGLRRIDVRTLRGHAHRSDLSRWIAEILQVRELAALVAGLEADLVREERTEHDVRAELLALIEEHYLEV